MVVAAIIEDDIAITIVGANIKTATEMTMMTGITAVITAVIIAVMTVVIIMVITIMVITIMAVTITAEGTTTGITRQ